MNWLIKDDTDTFHRTCVSVFRVMLDFSKQQVMLENITTQGQRSTLGCSLQSERRALMNWIHMETADAFVHFDRLPFSVAPCHRKSLRAFFLLFNIQSTPPVPLSLVTLYVYPISSSFSPSLSPPLVTLLSPADESGGAFVPPPQPPILSITPQHCPPILTPLLL